MTTAQRSLSFLVLHFSVINSKENRLLAPGLQRPQALQGHDDENWPALLSEDGKQETTMLAARYAALEKMKPGIRRYNMFWSAFEVVKSSTNPGSLNCSIGSEMHPSNGSDMRGFKRFHCYNTQQLKKFDLIFANDERIGAQGAGILYSAPYFYIHPNCTGFGFGPDVIRDGCVPRDDAMDDYEDYVNMLAERYSPHLKHYVVWNEVASAGWMDCSPNVPNRAGPDGSSPLTDAQFDRWVSKYADLVKRSSVAAARHSSDYMIWTSNDRLWERPEQSDGDPLHIGVRPFLDRLWPKLGINFSWNLAVHPYDNGNPMDDSEFAEGHHPQAYTFATLDRVVAYQRQQVLKVGGLDPDSPQGASFTWLFASEQGWPAPACCDDKVQARNICFVHALASSLHQLTCCDDKERARNICFAHALASSLPQLVAVTHNFFQDNPGGSEQGGQDFGLIAGNISGDLSNATGYPTFDAYNATSPSVWEQSDVHYCCQDWKVGCKSASTYGSLDNIKIATGYPPAVELHGWAWSTESPKAGFDPLEVAIVVDGKDVMRVVANISRPDLVIAAMSPSPNHGFIVGLPSLLCTFLQTGKHNISARAISSKTSEMQELESSPRCLCDFVPCPCDSNLFFV